MALRDLILACTLLVMCSADQTLTTVNSMLDPNRICWWRTKWAPAPIQLSINNKGKSSIVTFFISPTTSITAGVLEVTFPTGFAILTTMPTGVTGVTVSGQVVTLTGQTFVGGQDYAVSLPAIVTNPSSIGAYGPFALRTRYNTGGQQIDVNLSFGTVYIYTDANNISSSLTVALAGTTINNVINKSGNTLSFRFTIGVSLWRYDTFVINVDPKWTIASGATCSSADYSGKWNNFNGTNTANPHALQCFVIPKSTSSSQSVYIYGLAVDGVDLTSTADNAYVDLRVTSVTTPNAVYTASYSWTVGTFRFQTATNLETGTVTGGPVVAADTISTATWTPTWGMLNTDIIDASTYFMDMSFSITNALPENGLIEITVTEDVATGDSTWGNTDNCYVITYISKTVVCTADSTGIHLSKFPAVAAGTTIKLRNIVKFTRTASSSTAKINTITTYQTTGVKIDAGSSLASFAVATTNVKLITSANFGITFVDIYSAGANTANSAYSKAGGLNSSYQGIQFWVFPTTPADFTSTSTLTIHCPFTSAIDDFGIGVPNYSVKYLAGATPTADPGVASFGGSTAVTGTATLTPSSSSATHGTLVVSGTVGASVTTGLHFLIGPSSGATSYISLPRITNNYATAYECRVAVTTSGSIQRNAVRFSINSQDLLSAAVTVPCTDAVLGLPVMVTYQPNASLPIPSSSTGQTYYVEFTVSGVAWMSSGLTGTTPSSLTAADLLSYGVEYPHDKSVTATTIAKLYVVGTSNYIAVAGLPGMTSTSTAITVAFPIGAVGGSTYAISTEVYYVLSADPRYQFSSHYSAPAGIPMPTPNPATTSFKSATNSASPVAVSNSNQAVNGDASTTGLTLDVIYSGTNASNHYLYFVFPTGFTWTSGKSVRYLLSPAASYTTVYYFSSTTTLFAYPGVMFSTAITSSLGGNIGTTGSTTGSITISGFKLPLGAPGSASTITFLAGSSASNSACFNAGSISFNAQTGLITFTTIAPNTVKAYGPDGVNVKHAVTFTLTHGIPSDGSINLTVATDWTITGCTKCSVTATGLTAKSTGSLGCSVASGIATVTGFNDFSSSPGMQITIEVTGLVAPKSASATGTNFVTTLNTKTSTGLLIDVPASYSGTAVVVTSSSAIGAPSWTTKKTFPMNAASTAVDLYLKFSLPHSLPACGTIAITSPLSLKLTGTSVKNSCFLSPVKYNDCSLGSGGLSITLDSDYAAGTTLELFLDSAVDNPSTAVATTSSFSITSTWGGVTVDQDTTTGQTFTPTALLTSSITVPTSATGITFVPKTAMEVATYTFDFKDSVGYTVGDQYWIVFPSQYDYFLGDVWQWFTNEPNVYYIDCSSSQLGVTWCTVDHNVLVVSGSAATSANTEIVISVQGIINPVAAQTNAFQIIHVSAAGDYLTVNQNFGTVTPTSSATNIDVRSLSQVDRRIFKPSDLKWRLYIPDIMSVDSQLKVLFPREYDLSKFDKKDSYQCFTTWYDNSPAASIKTQQTWNAATSCAASGNWVTLPSPTTASTFTANHIVTWTIQAVGNPQWGQTRSALTTSQDFDVADSVLWPLDPMWASKFTFFVYHTSSTSLAYTSRSYPNMNAAYAGFYQGYRPLLVNGYVPQSKTNRIVVYAGTQTTDLYITTASANSPMSAKQIVLTPTTNSRTPDNGKLKYTSTVNSWTIVQSWWQIQFRVAAAIDMVKGLYYIDWSNNETKQTGVNDVQYDTPVSTLVEVIAKKAGQSNFAVWSVPDVSIGFSSIPIQISVTNAPHTDVTVNLSVTNTPANISVSPSALTFGPDVNTKYFQIQVASNYDIASGAIQTISFTLSGTDAEAFSIVSSTKFTILQPTTQITTGGISSWGQGTPTMTTMTVSPKAEQAGVIYYQLAIAGSAVPTFASLKTSVASLIDLNTTNSSPEVSDNSQKETDPLDGESWVDFQLRLYKAHIATKWVGSISVYSASATNPLKIDWLYANTRYQISGYFDNLGPTSSPTVRTEYFQTAMIADCQPFTVSFKGLVSQTFTDKIAQEAANAQGVNPKRLLVSKYGTSTTRALQGTTTTSSIATTSFSYTLLPNRFSESPLPANQAKITGAAYTTFLAALQADGIQNEFGTVANDAVPTRVTPTWTSSPTRSMETTTTVSLTLRSSVAGQACCVALTTAVTAPATEQVMLGMDSTNAVAPSACVQTDLTATTNVLQITGLTEATTYYVYCTSVDTYPLWPTQMAYSNTNPIEPVAITTSSPPTGTVSSAKVLEGLLLLVGFLFY